MSCLYYKLIFWICRFWQKSTETSSDDPNKWLDFVDLDLIFKVTRVYIYEKALSALSFLNQWPVFDQTYIDTSLVGLDLISLDLIFSSPEPKVQVRYLYVNGPAFSIHTFEVVYL